MSPNRNENTWDFSSPYEPILRKVRICFLPQQEEEEEEPHELLEPFLFLLSFQADFSSSVDDQTHEDQARLQAIPTSRPSSFIDSDLTICNYPNRAITTKNIHGELFLSPISESFDHTTSDQNTGSLAEHHDSSSGTISDPTDPTDPKLQRLWSLFLEARTEFNIEHTDNFQRTTAAKFLRDTIENCLSYISSYPFSVGNYPEEATGRETLLKDTLKLAIEAAERGSGGRKRRFDIEAKKKTFTTHGAGGISATRRGGRANVSRANAHGNGGKKQAVYHAASYKGYHLWGISYSFDKLTPHPHIRGTRRDDWYAAKIYVPARFEIARRPHECPHFFSSFFLSCCGSSLIHTYPDALAFPRSFNFFLSPFPHKLTLAGPLRSNRAGFLPTSIRNERTQGRMLSHFSLVLWGWGRFFFFSRCGY